MSLDIRRFVGGGCVIVTHTRSVQGGCMSRERGIIVRHLRPLFIPT